MTQKIERTKRLIPVDTIIGVTNGKFQGRVMTFNVFYGNACLPVEYTNGKFVLLPTEKYEKILLDFLQSEYGQSYIVPSRSEIYQDSATTYENIKKHAYDDTINLFYRLNSQLEPEPQEEVKEQENVPETQEASEVNEENTKASDETSTEKESIPEESVNKEEIAEQETTNENTTSEQEKEMSVQEQDNSENYSTEKVSEEKETQEEVSSLNTKEEEPNLEKVEEPQKEVIPEKEEASLEVDLEKALVDAVVDKNDVKEELPKENDTDTDTEGLSLEDLGIEIYDPSVYDLEKFAKEEPEVEEKTVEVPSFFANPVSPTPNVEEPTQDGYEPIKVEESDDLIKEKETVEAETVVSDEEIKQVNQILEDENNVAETNEETETLEDVEVVDDQEKINAWQVNSRNWNSTPSTRGKREISVDQYDSIVLEKLLNMENRLNNFMSNEEHRFYVEKDLVPAETAKDALELVKAELVECNEKMETYKKGHKTIATLNLVMLLLQIALFGATAFFFITKFGA